jgi:hypothetical protein
MKRIQFILISAAAALIPSYFSREKMIERWLKAHDFEVKTDGPNGRKYVMLIRSGRAVSKHMKDGESEFALAFQYLEISKWQWGPIGSFVIKMNRPFWA